VRRQEHDPPGGTNALQRRFQREFRHRLEFVGPSECEGQPAEFRRRASHPRHALGSLANVLQEATPRPPVRDRRLPGLHLGRQRRQTGADERQVGIGGRFALAERDLREPDGDHVSRRQGTFRSDHLSTHERAVAAPQVANRPASAGRHDLGVRPAGPLVVDDDAVGGRPPQGDGFPGHQPGHAAADDGIPNDQIR
jgi:hypothetical protein